MCTAGFENVKMQQIVKAFGELGANGRTAIQSTKVYYAKKSSLPLEYRNRYFELKMPWSL